MERRWDRDPFWIFDRLTIVFFGGLTDLNEVEHALSINRIQDRLFVIKVARRFNGKQKPKPGNISPRISDGTGSGN
jgi:hypothetical protein